MCDYHGGQCHVSIHPPRVGRDRACTSGRLRSLGFNPPSPCGEGQKELRMIAQALSVSIHPPRVGRDTEKKSISLTISMFQSTLPVWGGTAKAHKNSL